MSSWVNSLLQFPPNIFDDVFKGDLDSLKVEAEINFYRSKWMQHVRSKHISKALVSNKVVLIIHGIN